MPEKRDTKEIKRIASLIKNAKVRVLNNKETATGLRAKIKELKGDKIDLVKDVKVYQEMMKVHAKEKKEEKKELTEIQKARIARVAILKKAHKATITTGSFTSELKGRRNQAKQRKIASNALEVALLNKRKEIFNEQIKEKIVKLKTTRAKLTDEQKKKNKEDRAALKVILTPAQKLANLRAKEIQNLFSASSF